MIQIKLYDQKFHSDVVALILDIQQNEFNVPITLDDQPDLIDILGHFRQKKSNFWLAFHHDELVGTIGLLDFEKSKGCIRKMFVKSAFRGSKHRVAQQLVEVLFTYSREQNFQFLYLGTVAILAAAIKFYKKNGFVEISKADLPKQFPLMSVDTNFFRLEIDQ